MSADTPAPTLPEPLSTVIVGPNDTLVVTVGFLADVADYAEQLELVRPDLKGRILFLSGVDQIGVLKAEES
jgi:hypothetical protein